MITSIKEFKLILENKVDSDKLTTLVEKAREYIANVKKSEEYKELKKQQDSELREILSRVDMASVEANGVLVKVIKPHTKYKLNTTEYFNFVENSTDVITKEFAKVVDELKKAHTKITSGKEYIKQTKNTKNKETGEITTEAFGEKIKSFISSLVTKFDKFIDSIMNKLKSIEDKAEKFMVKPVTEGFEEEKAEILNNPNITPEERKRLLNNLSSKYSHSKRREGLKTTKEILEIAKSTIDTTKQAQFYEQLAQSNEKELIDMLKEFDAKSIVIDDVILSLGKANDVETFDEYAYSKQITDAEIVGENIAKMAKALELIHQKEYKAKGEVVHEPVVAENIFKTALKYIQKFITYFKIASKKVDNALADLSQFAATL